MLPGLNILKFTDLHNCKYSITFDRPLHGNRFGFDISVTGYNFSTSSGEIFLCESGGRISGDNFKVGGVLYESA